MPLHPENRKPLVIQSLHHEIRPVLGCPKTLPEGSDRLVMGAVDPRKAAIKLCRKGTVRSFCYVNFVRILPGMDSQGFQQSEHLALV